MRTFSLTFGSTCSCNSCISYLSMAKSVNYFLCNNCFATLLTLRTICETSLCAICIVTGNNFSFGVCASCIAYVTANVTGCIVDIIISVIYHRNFALSNENLATSRAVLTFGETCLVTRRSNSSINYFCMTLCRNDFLRNKYFVTSGAVRSFSKTCLCTCSLNSCINNLCMTKSGSYVSNCDSVAFAYVTNRSHCAV